MREMIKLTSAIILTNGGSDPLSGHGTWGNETGEGHHDANDGDVKLGRHLQRPE